MAGYWGLRGILTFVACRTRSTSGDLKHKEYFNQDVWVIQREARGQDTKNSVWQHLKPDIPLKAKVTNLIALSDLSQSIKQI